MRTLMLVGLVLVTAAIGCDRRGGRIVVLTPDEVPSRQGDQWHVTQEPAAGPAAERAEGR